MAETTVRRKYQRKRSKGTRSEDNSEILRSGKERVEQEEGKSYLRRTYAFTWLPDIEEKEINEKRGNATLGSNYPRS